jgi:uncharacterized membrane protein YedE/YeeE
MDQAKSSVPTQLTEKSKQQFDLQTILPFIPSFIFGFALQRGRVHENSIVIGQMTFAHLVMLKMFFSALGSSCLVMAHYFQTKCQDEIQRESYYQRTNRGLKAIIIGAALVGVGMTLAGSCPGTVYAQLGVLSLLAVPIFIGSVFGAIFFEQFIQQQYKTVLIEGTLPKEQNAIYKLINHKFKLNLTPEQFLTYMGGGMLGFALLLELIFNWKSDLSGLYPKTYQDITIFFAQPAIISGIMIGGLAQYISVNYLNKQLGCSYTFVEFAQIGFSKLLTPFAIQSKNPHCEAICRETCESISKPSCEPSPITAYGLIAGAFIGMLSSGSLYVGRNAEDFPQMNLLLLIIRLTIGGFLAVLGARIAGGCTSGLGLSYTSTGSTNGMIGMMTMFGSAILSGIIIKVLF